MLIAGEYIEPQKTDALSTKEKYYVLLPDLEIEPMTRGARGDFLRSTSDTNSDQFYVYEF